VDQAVKKPAFSLELNCKFEETISLDSEKKRTQLAKTVQSDTGIFRKPSSEANPLWGLLQ
jgi:hypothetical protein